MSRLPRFEVPSYGMKGGPLRYPKGRTGESQYNRETRLRQEMQMRLREQKFALPVQEEQMRLQNKMEAEGWELKYSTATRAEVAKWNEALQRLNRDPSISSKEKEAMRQQIMQSMYGAEKTWTPPDPNKPIYPKGQGIGDFWMGDDGSTITRDKDGIPKLVQRYDQGPEHHKMEAQRAWEEKRSNLMLELTREEEEVPGEGDKPPTKKRKYDNWEVQELLNAGGYSSANAPLPQGAPQQAPAPPPQPQVTMEPPPQARPAPARPPVVRPQATRALDKVISDIDLKFTEADKDLPEQVRVAQAFLRVAKERDYFNRKVSPLMAKAIVEALQIGVEYNAAR